MRRVQHNYYFKLTTLAATLAWSGLALAAPLTNGDFSTNDFTGWQGDVTSSSTIDPLPGGFTDNFNASTGAAVLTTSFDTDATNFNVELLQTIDLPANAIFMSFAYDWTADDNSDTWQAQLIDTANASHSINYSNNVGSGNGSFDLTSFAGLNVQLLFSLQNNGGQDDRLSIDDIAIEERSGSTVPVPSVLWLMAAGLVGFRFKKA